MGTPKAPDTQAVARPDDPIDLTGSVAGEEDPGASIDVVGTPARPDAEAKPPRSTGMDCPGGGT